MKLSAFWILCTFTHFFLSFQASSVTDLYHLFLPLLAVAGLRLLVLCQLRPSRKLPTGFISYQEIQIGGSFHRLRFYFAPTMPWLDLGSLSILRFFSGNSQVSGLLHAILYVQNWIHVRQSSKTSKMKHHLKGVISSNLHYVQRHNRDYMYKTNMGLDDFDEVQFCFGFHFFGFFLLLCMSLI